MTEATLERREAVPAPAEDDARASRPRWQPALAAAVYALTAVLLTWPVARGLGSTIFGHGGDAWADIATLREFVERLQLPFIPGEIEDFNAPEGWEYGYPLYVATWASALPKWALGVAFGPIAGYNLFVLAGYVLSGSAMFLLARRLTGNWFAALVAGWAFAFWPFAVEKGKAHVEFVHGWVLVLLLWRLLALQASPTLRNGLLAGVAGVVALSFNPYFLLMAAVLWATVLVVGLVPAWREGVFRDYARAHAVGGALALVAVAVYGIVSATGPEGGIPSRELSELVTYSARPLEYLVPHPDTLVLGDETRSWWETHLHGSSLSESGVYVGLTTLLLALVGLGAAATRRLAPALRRATWTTAAVALVGGAFSAPPFFQPGGITVHMPSWLVFQVAQTWRVYSRFGVVVMLGVALLAAVGLSALMRGGSRRRAVAIGALAAVLVPLDLWARPDNGTTPVPEPPVYAALTGEPRGIVAEYPVLPTAVPEYQWALFQDLHDRPLLNGYPSGSREEARALWLYDLADPRVPPRLALLGVRHVVLNETAPAPGFRLPGRPARGFRLLRRVEGRSLYRVTARPARSLTWPAQGFSTVEGAPGGHYSWLVSPKGEIDVLARCRPCRGELRFTGQSSARPRRLRITGPDGRLLLDRTVGTEPQRFRVPLSFHREARVQLRVTPGPAPIGGGDPRHLAILVREPVFVEAR